MRKLIWCCSTAGLLAAGSFLSIASYAYRHPDSTVGRAVMTAARASVAMQPLSGLASMAQRAVQSESKPHETAGGAEECVPAEPHPVAVEQEIEVVKPEVLEQPNDAQEDAAPIVIGEDEPMPVEEVVQAVPAPIDANGMQGQNIPPNGCPILMPYCKDDDEPQATPPAMPYAGEDEVKSAEPKADGAGEESEHNVFNAWKKIFEEGQEHNATSAEELPMPTEEHSSERGISGYRGEGAEELPPPTEEEQEQQEPKCEEDPHRHEHYSGCPHTITCPYTGKSYPSRVPATKSGREENSEEPVEQPATPQDNKPHCGDAGKNKEQCPRTQGVDTMEYRPSDGGLNEYGPSPLH